MEKKKLAVVVMLALASGSFGATSFVYTPSTTTVQAGDLLTLQVSLVTDAPVIGMSYVPTVSSNGSGYFELVTRDLTGVDAAWDPTRTNAQLIFPQTLSPSATGGDFGFTDGSETPHTGTIFLGTLTIKVLDGIAPGFYTFSTQSSTAGNPDYEDIDATPASAMVEVVPEPVSVSLLAMGGLALLRRKFA